jgi:hypothetical protein
MCSDSLACYSTNVNEAIGTPKTQEMLFGNGSVFLEECAVAVPSSVKLLTLKTFSVRILNISAAATDPCQIFRAVYENNKTLLEGVNGVSFWTLALDPLTSWIKRRIECPRYVSIWKLHSSRPKTTTVGELIVSHAKLNFLVVFSLSLIDSNIFCAA